MRGSSATAFRLRAATRSLTRASLALTSSFMDWAILLAGRQGSSSRAAPMRASMRASQRSVLASLPVASAKRLARRGLTLTKGRLHLFSVLVLSRGHDPRVSVQAAGKREGWSNYKTVLPDCRAPDPPALAP